MTHGALKTRALAAKGTDMFFWRLFLGAAVKPAATARPGLTSAPKKLRGARE